MVRPSVCVCVCVRVWEHVFAWRCMCGRVCQRGTSVCVSAEDPLFGDAVAAERSGTPDERSRLLGNEASSSSYSDQSTPSSLVC